MNFLMLRGQVPQDRDPQEIVFDRLEEVDDVWTQLFYNLLDNDDYGELWYWGGERVKKFKHNFIEKWTRPFHEYGVKHSKCIDPGFIPDIIFCRGGFPQYHPVLERFPNTIKIYYGAGTRFLPQPGFYDYDIILQDSPEQVKICKEKFPRSLTTLFIKPAADNIFYPLNGIKKEYDICYPADGRPPRKGHDFIYPTAPKDLKILNLGFSTKRFVKPSNITSYRVLKPELSKHMQKCKIGIVASTKGTGLFGSSYDSCPRIIPEMIACGLPIVVLDELEFWSDKYITPMTGKLANRDNYWNVVRDVLFNEDKYDPRKYYEENLSLNHAAKFLRRKIDEVRV